MKISSRLALAAAAVTLACLTAGCAATAAPAETGGGTASLSLGLVQGQDFIHAMPARVAEAQGMFEDAGLEVDIVDFTSGSDLTKAMAGGSIDVGAATGLDAVSGAAHDVDLQAFWGIYAPSPMALVVAPDSDITGFADLAGAKVGISRVGSMTDYTVRAALDAEGVDLADVTEVPLGDPASTMAGLASGDVDAFVLPVNFGYAVEADGTGQIAQMAADAIGGTDQFAILMASSTFISDNEATLRTLTEVYTQAIEWMADNRDDAIALAVEDLGMKEDIASRTYDELIGQFSADGAIDLEGLAAYASALPDLGIAETSPEQSAYFSDTFQN
jgi:NitT/TauT family transport system substrate-binding protein